MLDAYQARCVELAVVFESESFAEWGEVCGVVLVLFDGAFVDWFADLVS